MIGTKLELQIDGADSNIIAVDYLEGYDQGKLYEGEIDDDAIYEEELVKVFSKLAELFRDKIGLDVDEMGLDRKALYRLYKFIIVDRIKNLSVIIESFIKSNEESLYYEVTGDKLSGNIDQNTGLYSKTIKKYRALVSHIMEEPDMIPDNYIERDDLPGLKFEHLCFNISKHTEYSVIEKIFGDGNSSDILITVFSN